MRTPLRFLFPPPPPLTAWDDLDGGKWQALAIVEWVAKGEGLIASIHVEFMIYGP